MYIHWTLLPLIHSLLDDYLDRARQDIEMVADVKKQLGVTLGGVEQLEAFVRRVLEV